MYIQRVANIVDCLACSGAFLLTKSRNRMPTPVRLQLKFTHSGRTYGYRCMTEPTTCSLLFCVNTSSALDFAWLNILRVPSGNGVVSWPPRRAVHADAGEADEGQSGAVLERVPVCGFDFARRMMSTRFSLCLCASMLPLFEGSEIMHV